MEGFTKVGDPFWLWVAKITDNPYKFSYKFPNLEVMAFCGAIALTKSPPFGAYRQEKVHPNWPSPSGILSGDGFIKIWFLAKPNGGAQTKKNWQKKNYQDKYCHPSCDLFSCTFFFLPAGIKFWSILLRGGPRHGIINPREWRKING